MENIIKQSNHVPKQPHPSGSHHYMRRSRAAKRNPINSLIPPNPGYAVLVAVLTQRAAAQRAGKLAPIYHANILQNGAVKRMHPLFSCAGGAVIQGHRNEAGQLASFAHGGECFMKQQQQVHCAAHHERGKCAVKTPTHKHTPCGAGWFARRIAISVRHVHQYRSRNLEFFYATVTKSYWERVVHRAFVCTNVT